MTKPLYLAAAALGVVTTTALVSLVTFAHPGAINGESRQQHHQAMVQSFQNNDYDAWAAEQRERVAALRQHADELEARINETTFSQLREAHQLLQDGKIDEAKAIFDELGLPRSGFGHRMMHRGMMLGQSPDDSSSQ